MVRKTPEIHLELFRRLEFTFNHGKAEFPMAHIKLCALTAHARGAPIVDEYKEITVDCHYFKRTI